MPSGGLFKSNMYHRNRKRPVENLLQSHHHLPLLQGLEEPQQVEHPSIPAPSPTCLPRHARSHCPKTHLYRKIPRHLDKQIRWVAIKVPYHRERPQPLSLLPLVRLEERTGYLLIQQDPPRAGHQLLEVRVRLMFAYLLVVHTANQLLQQLQQQMPRVDLLSQRMENHMSSQALSLLNLHTGPVPPSDNQLHSHSQPISILLRLKNNHKKVTRDPIRCPASARSFSGGQDPCSVEGHPSPLHLEQGLGNGILPQA